MAEKTKIQWSDATVNFWIGCRHKSLGCRNCYADRFVSGRFKKDFGAITRTKTATFNAPLKWKDARKIFVCSLSDFFIKEGDQWRSEAWEIIKATPWHTYQILTKRPERIKECLPDDWGDGYPNVWLGVSVENQEIANLRIPILTSIPAKVHFLSIEPLLAPVVLDPLWFRDEFYLTNLKKQIGWGITWVIIGGESGNENGKYKYRECEMYWIFDIINQCDAYNVPVFVKQLGTYLSKEMGLKDRHGGNMDEWYSELQVRQMPDAYEPKN